jgi:hypothetical protein
LSYARLLFFQVNPFTSNATFGIFYEEICFYFGFFYDKEASPG